MGAMVFSPKQRQVLTWWRPDSPERDRQAIIRSRTAGTYRRSLRILRGNPSANTREFGEALEALRELAGKRPGPRA